jgi:hypothetical protein
MKPEEKLYTGRYNYGSYNHTLTCTYSNENVSKIYSWQKGVTCKDCSVKNVFKEERSQSQKL